MRKTVLSIIVLAAIAAPRAADNPAWFGTPAPPPLSDPRKPIMKYDDTFAPLPTAFTHRTGKHDERLTLFGHKLCQGGGEAARPAARIHISQDERIKCFQLSPALGKPDQVDTAIGRAELHERAPAARQQEPGT